MSRRMPSIALLPTLMTAATVKLAPTTAPPTVPAVPNTSGTPTRNNRYFPTNRNRLANLCAIKVPKRVPVPITTEGRAVLTARVFCTARNLACSTTSASEAVSAEATWRVDADASDMVAAISVSSIPDQRECTTSPVSDDVVSAGSTTRRRRWGNFDVDEVAFMMTMLRASKSPCWRLCSKLERSVIIARNGIRMLADNFHHTTKKPNGCTIGRGAAFATACHGHFALPSSGSAWLPRRLTSLCTGLYLRVCAVGRDRDQLDRLGPVFAHQPQINSRHLGAPQPLR